MRVDPNSPESGIQEAIQRTTKLSLVLQELVDNIVKEVCKELDDYVAQVDKAVRKSEAVSDIQLEHFMLNIPSLIYIVSQRREELGIKSYVGKMIQKDVYSRMRQQSEGTVADKDAAAILASQTESVAATVFQSAYDTIKAREEAAMELYSAVKKTVSRRMSEMQLSNEVRN